MEKGAVFFGTKNEMCETEMLRNVTKCHDTGSVVFDTKNEMCETEMSRNITKMLRNVTKCDKMSRNVTKMLHSHV